MINKPLIASVVGFLAGGLLVSLAYTTFDKPTVSPMSNEEMSMAQMTDMLKPLTGDKYDAAFIDYMTQHHEAAVEMAKLSATNAKHEEIKTLSKEIITTQNKEIDEMKQWRADWGYMAVQSDSAHMSH